MRPVHFDLPGLKKVLQAPPVSSRPLWSLPPPEAQRPSLFTRGCLFPAERPVLDKSPAEDAAPAEPPPKRLKTSVCNGGQKERAEGSQSRGGARAWWGAGNRGGGL